MKRSNLFILLILVLAAVLFFWLRSGDNESTLDVKSSFFQLKDTSTVTRVFTSDIDGNQVLLERKNFYWLVNGKHRANRTAIKNLFEPLVRMYVKSPVSDKHRKEMIKEMTVGHRKVEVYRGDELSRVYYIGNATADGLGTYVFSNDEGLDRPYIVHIPGWNGNLSPRFFTDELSWKSKKLFHTSPANFDYLRVDYNNQPEFSYQINYNENGETQVVDAVGTPLAQADNRKAKEVLMASNKIYLEDYLPKISGPAYDSVMNIIPEFARITVKLNGKDEQIAIVKLRESEETDQPIEEIPIERFYVYVIGNERETLGLLQHAMGAKLLKKIDRFDLTK